MKALQAAAAVGLLCTSALAASDLEAAPAVAQLPGLRAELQDVTQAYAARSGVPHLRWQSFWVLQWAPAAGAKHYEIRYKTAEGTSRKVKAVVEPGLRLEVARGDNPKAAGMVARTTQLETIGSLLSVQVVARLQDGRTAVVTPWLQVGAPVGPAGKGTP
ncbi:hypothetical protein [Rubrivivax rivuli]|uniref:Uncharacterized protein n=1 Tax=Rubrivivax rivuli TaxID=1862385 RepID=A0A437RHY9_9BURK|nr:hypothetical protein [Rubrivivax rivuli]RVU46386.1 hypothetical protein EOE66_11165 [Rubrivivax rivuli]